MEVLQDTYPDRCVCCGRPVPEGRMVCFGCESGQTHFAPDRFTQLPDKKEKVLEREEPGL